MSVRAGTLVRTLELKKKIWQTEVANLGRNDPGIRDALYWAKVLHTHVAENHANAWLYWWAISQYGGGGSLIHLDMDKKTYTVDKRLYTIGNYSRFVKPGYFRVEVDGQMTPGVLVSAYKDEATHKLVVVAINENEGPQKLELKLAGAGAASAVPCRTSENEDLVTLPAVQFADSTLSATLAPASVTTFVSTVAPVEQ